jgi:sodium transport system permease protein
VRAAWSVFWKELLDALRDRRTLVMVLLSSVAIGPVVLVALSALVGQMEQRAEERVVLMQGVEHAPSLRNHLERQTWTVRAAPPDFERELREGRLSSPVVVVPADFEERLGAMDPPLVEVFSSSAHPKTQSAAGSVERLLSGFGQEQAMLRLALRGVAPGTLQAVQVQPRDLADRAGRAAQLMLMLPFFVLMAMMYGALNAALDTTAGERERGSLEPLLMNPAPAAALVVGKWGAVAAVGMLIAVLSVLSFLPGQWLLRSEALSALFQFGPGEAAWFLALLLPLAGALAALLMAVAIRCKTFKEAQANATIVLLAGSMVPLINLVNPGATQGWHLAVPVLGQMTLMTQVLRGEPPLPLEVLTTVGASLLVTALALASVTRALRSAALR